MRPVFPGLGLVGPLRDRPPRSRRNRVRIEERRRRTETEVGLQALHRLRVLLSGVARLPMRPAPFANARNELRRRKAIEASPKCWRRGKCPVQPS
ncbi:hypothetical protein CGRA01v4_05096 [Colletotrichum graminicola]|nr:hypothetical protein CGRA01v4_05096 [Colletotrichum graminicola]